MEDTTKFTLIDEWWGPDYNDGQWPYPDRYTKSSIEGTLAERIRAKLGADWEAPVFITETEISGGYSEYTQENTFDFVLECAGITKEFDDGNGWDNGLSLLLKWLEEA